MAKGNAMGLWKGKKGSTVFYQIANSNSKQKQGMRERNYEPSNPQSYSQAGQRMRMYPAQAVYGALKSTIERSWQGVKYGQMTRQAYLKIALREEIFPAVAKGTNGAVPGPYVISKGSLPEITGIISDADEITLSLFGEQGSTETPIGEVSVALLQFNPFLKEGDQITIVFCISDYNGDGFQWGVQSFLVDTSNTDPVSTLSQKGVDLTFDSSGIRVTPTGDRILYAAACIISREETTPLRSTARLTVRYDQLGAWYDATAVAAARKSYQKQEYVRDVDWPVDPDGADDESSTTITITAQAYPEADRGTVTGGGRYERGALVTLTATPVQGYQLIGWYPSATDAAIRTNEISTAGVLTFLAGDSSAVGGTTTFYARFDLAG